MTSHTASRGIPLDEPYANTLGATTRLLVLTLLCAPLHGQDPIEGDVLLPCGEG